MMKGHKKRPAFYDFFIIPSDHSKVRKLKVSHWHLRAIFLAACLGVLFIAFNAVGFWYYRYLHTTLLTERQAYRGYEQEKSRLADKMKRLEESLEVAEEYTGKLAGMVGAERPRLKKGIGPLPAARDELKRILETTEEVNLAALEPKMSGLEERGLTLEDRVRELYSIQEDRLLYLAATPSIWPVKGWVTSDFGTRRSPFSFERDFHSGIDIASQYGTPVRAAADGVVTFAAFKGGMGRTVMLDHGFGIFSAYGHTSALFVREGQRVKRGVKIAAVGNSGHSTGPHLHYEIRVDGVAVDPMKYILQ